MNLFTRLCRTLFGARSAHATWTRDVCPTCQTPYTRLADNRYAMRCEACAARTPDPPPQSVREIAESRAYDEWLLRITQAQHSQPLQLPTTQPHKPVTRVLPEMRVRDYSVQFERGVYEVEYFEEQERDPWALLLNSESVESPGPSEADRWTVTGPQLPYLPPLEEDVPTVKVPTIVRAIQEHKWGRQA